MTIASRIETISNVSLIAASVFVCVSLGTRIWGTSSPSGVPLDLSYSRGDTLPILEGVRYGDAPKTILLFVSSTCKFCQESMPFYQKLSAMQDPETFQLVITGPEPADALGDYVTHNGVSAVRVLTIGPGLLRVRGTPTLILADREGHVLGYWRGLLRDREAEVEDALTK